MQHRRPVPHSVNSCRHGLGRSPLAEFEQAFLALAEGPQPLTFPAHLVCDEPDRAAWPVDRVRAHLAHPATRPQLREQTWQEVIRRARVLGDPWDIVAVAMSIPVLRRVLARVARPAHLQRAELEQEALVAVACALRTVDLGQERADRELFREADRAVHRLAYAARRAFTWESVSAPEHWEKARDSCDGLDGESATEFSVLAQAVQAGVLNITEARLIARTRLGEEPMNRLAVERGVSMRQLYRHRNAAEQHLAAYLRHRLRQA
jgi:hypothetical protein